MCIQGAAYRTICPCHEGVMISLTTDPIGTEVVQFSVCLFFSRTGTPFFGQMDGHGWT